MRALVFIACLLCAALAAGQDAPSEETKPMHTNRLSGETSPYLLQHAHNPVDWCPWGEEAFEEARRRDVPIFLSIGYSTCYWCHVMERESFESASVAKVMNEHFVNVKVDREERPDVDDIYMAATQALTGRGGWPMSVWLEPESLRPFYAGTYFPPESRHGLPSFTELLVGISEAWKSDRRGEILDQSESLADAVRHQLASQDAPVVVGEEQISQAITGLLQIYDQQRGGFGGAPKFPQPTYIEFLLSVREAGDTQTREAIDQAVRGTLDAMMIGGIRDHVGGGFHRYSVDAEWTVPHFEKMLYDQGQMLSVYAKAGAVYDDDEYVRTAEAIAKYLFDEMVSDQRAFFSAQDAEVDGKEGLNYLWTDDEIRDALDEGDVEFALDVYGVASGPNFKDPHHPDEPARSVLRLEARPEVIAEKHALSLDEFHSRMERINAALLNVRNERKQPRLDDKILSAWNGIAIQGLAVLGNTLRHVRYVVMGETAARDILGRLRDENGALLRSARGDTAQISGFLDDYAWLTLGLLELHRATGEQDWLDKASELAREADALFGDPETGAFFDTRENQSDLFVRGRNLYDGAIPSATSVFLHCLIDLAELTDDDWFADRAALGIAATSGAIHRSPVGHINSTHALYRAMAAGLPLEAAFEKLGASQPEETDGQNETFQAVEVFADTDRVTLQTDGVEQFRVRLEIAEGYHIVAADPGEAGEGVLEPLRVRITGGTGIKLFADYPTGAPYQTEGVEGEVLAHTGSVEFDIVLEADGERTGRPMVIVTFQACSDTECLMPTTVELDVAID